MKYRDRLPQLDSDLFLTDGGIETVLIFHEGFDLPAFAAFDLLKDEAGTAALRAYYAPYVALASERGVGFVAESPTWRASPRWAAELGYSPEQLDAFNRRAIALMEDVRAEYETERSPVVISGCIGPSDDGYNPAELLSADVAEAYHSTQIATFADTAADMVTAITMTYAEEAIGITRAASTATACRSRSRSRSRPTGACRAARRCGDAIEQVDDATGAAPAYYMINCAHPTHFEGVLDTASRGSSGSAACGRTRRRAATRSSTRRPTLDEGDPIDLGARYAALASKPAAAERARRLLRDGPPPRRRDRRRLACARVAMEQEVRFCSVPGGRIAYATAGSGPPLVIPALWISHVELEWEFPEFRTFIAALAETHTVIRYDRLGTGLSDRDAAPAPSGATAVGGAATSGGTDRPGGERRGGERRGDGRRGGERRGSRRCRDALGAHRCARPRARRPARRLVRRAHRGRVRRAPPRARLIARVLRRLRARRRDRPAPAARGARGHRPRALGRGLARAQRCVAAGRERGAARPVRAAAAGGGERRGRRAPRSRRSTRPTSATCCPL